MIRLKSTGEMSNLVLIAVLFRCFLGINSVVGAPIRSDDTHASKTTAASSGEYRVEKFILPDGYDKTQVSPPTTQVINSSAPGDIRHVTVDVMFHISSVEMNEAKQEILLHAYTYLEWIETMTESNTEIPSNSTFASVDEEPSLIIYDVLSLEPGRVGKLYHVRSDGTGYLIGSQILRVKCPLDFTYFPADTQECIVKFSCAKDGYKTKLVWNRPPFMDPIPADNHAVAIDNKQRFRVGTTEFLQFSIKFRRKVAYHLLQTYIPSMLFVMITGLCFLMPKRVVELRIGVTMTTLLTLTSMFSSVRQIPPIVIYVKAIDVWMCACIAFVFVVLLVFILLLWVDAGKLDEEERAIWPLPVNKLAKRGKFRCSCSPRKGKWLTRICRWVIGFIEDHSFLVMLTVLGLLNGVYWSWLLTYSGYFEWNVDPTMNKLGSEQDMKSKIFLQDTES